MSAFGGFVGRLLLASLFILSGAMKFSHYNPQSGGPVVAYMSPKMDNVLQHLHRTAGIHVPLQQVHNLWKGLDYRHMLFDCCVPCHATRCTVVYMPVRCYVCVLETWQEQWQGVG